MMHYAEMLRDIPTWTERVAPSKFLVMDSIALLAIAWVMTCMVVYMHSVEI